MNVFGPRSKRRASAGCGSELKIKTGTASFRSRSLDPQGPNRHRRSMSERIATPLSSLPGACRDSYFTSATSRRAFALGLITFTKARKGKTFATVSVVDEANVAQHRRLFDAFAEKFQGGRVLCAG
jgi:hypothetical protein